MDGDCLVGCVVDGVRLAGRSGGLGFATVVMLIFGGWPKTFVRRTSAVYCRARPPRWERVLRRRIAEFAAREPGRLGPPRQPHGSVKRRGCQRELVILRRLGVRCLGGSGAACVRGSPAGRDAGGPGSG